MHLWNQNIVHQLRDYVLTIFAFIYFFNRNLKPESIYLRGENSEENCSLVLGDMVPSSVAYDLRMRTRLPRRMYDE